MGDEADGVELDGLRAIERGVLESFAQNRQILSFDDYFELFKGEPERQSRTAPRYLRDCLDHFGQDEPPKSSSKPGRYRLFDCPWEDSSRGGVYHRVVGQEEAQADLYRVLTNFIQEGRVTRFVLLHGPNGSAKSSFIRCLARGLEAYSKTPEGAIYTFNWVFPSSRLAKKRLGFADQSSDASVESYAHLEDDDVDARLSGDLRDHPLLLIPRAARRKLFDQLKAAGHLEGDFQVPEYLRDGDLSPRSRAVADALLVSYKGDLQRVLQHVQVERFSFSLRYRRGVVTIEPQLHVDASIRQVTMDQQLQSLPPSLRSLNLYEPMGDLVDSNRGLVEYNDLLKKPLDSYKYLLATCEKGTVALPSAILHLDTLFFASSNERHLAAFKEYPDFPSFKGRMDLIKMPYLRNYQTEQAIYEEQIAQGGLAHLVAPHATYVVALWAVLTRLVRPNYEGVPESIRNTLRDMSPLEKAEFYAEQAEPEGLSPEQVKELRAWRPMMLAERQAEIDYEGSFGASPREMKEVLLNALQDDRRATLTPLGVFDELRELVKRKSVYEFLQQKSDHGYHDHERFIEDVFGRWLERATKELQSSIGLIRTAQYDELFSRYILHISYTLKGERIYNESTGRSEEPDEALIKQLESVWKVNDNQERFRRDLIGRIGAWRIDFPGEEMNYRRLFPELFRGLERDYFERQKSTVRKVGEHLLVVLGEDQGLDSSQSKKLSKQDRAQAEDVIQRLIEEFDYPRSAIRETVATVLSQRF